MGTTRVRSAVAAAGLSALLLAAGAAGPASASVTASASASASASLTASGTAAAPGAVSATRLAAATPFPGKSPAAVLALATATGKKATGLRVKGKVVEGKETATVDGVLQKTAAKVTFTGTDIGRFTLLRSGSAVYLNGDAKFWTTAADAATAKTLVGKWVTVAGNDADAKELRAQTTIAYWMNDLASFKVTKRVAGKKIRGLPTVGLVDPAADGGTIFVAAKGKPYPLKIVSPDGKNTVSYSEWNKRVKIKPPAKNLIVVPVA